MKLTKAVRRIIFCAALPMAAALLLVEAAPAFATAPPYLIDASGGDCSLIGNWDGSSHTCTLNRDITVSGAGGILITGDNITLDGAGHTITGDGSTAAMGVEADSRTNITIKNITVQHFEDGIYFGGTNNSYIKENTSRNNWRDGISINSSSNDNTDGNSSWNNSDVGINDYNSSGDRIMGNNVQSNGGGILLMSGNSTSVISNIVAGSAVNGIYVTSSSLAFVRGNKVSFSTADGINLNNSSNTRVADNSFLNNTTQAEVAGGAGNNFFDGYGAGNYWSDYSSPAQGCHDTNANGVCDAPKTFTGGSDPDPLTLPFESTNYYWSWYDNAGGDDWMLLGNQPGGLDAWFDLDIAGIGRTLPSVSGLQPGEVPSGSTITPAYTGLVTGPVVADARSGGDVIASQRILWPKGGSSIEEVPGTQGGALSNIFYWPWYDQTNGRLNWVMITNPESYQVYYELYIAGSLRASGNLSPGSDMLDQVQGLIGGPVEVEAWTSAAKTEPARIAATQRVLSAGGTAFNEVSGIRGDALSLSSDYYWTWYDQTNGNLDWIMIANPPDAALPIYYSVTIAGVQMLNGGDPVWGPVAPGASATPSFPGVKNGPVEVITFTDPAHPGLSAANSICTQRVLWGPSFEEVPGKAHNALAPSSEWTWYDQNSPGMTDWMMISNPSASSIYYEVKVGATLRDSGTIAAGGMIEDTYPGLIGGPVEVSTWTDATKATPAFAITSQRVLHNGFFNEVGGS